MQENKQKSRIAKVFVRSPSKRLQSALEHGTSSGSSEAAAATNSNGKSGKSIRPHDNKITSKSGSVPRKAWEQQPDDDHIIEQVARATYESPQMQQKQLLGSAGKGSNGHYNSMDSGHLLLSEEGLVNVTLVADEQGRFGFNVKGGADLKMPVLVSRVAPHTPADLSTPRISEGDQVLMINGRDISALRHEQVVSLIRASREFRGGELVLTIKPQGECEDEVSDSRSISISCYSSSGGDRGGAFVLVRARVGRSQLHCPVHPVAPVAE